MSERGIDEDYGGIEQVDIECNSFTYASRLHNSNVSTRVECARGVSIDDDLDVSMGGHRVMCKRKHS